MGVFSFSDFVLEEPKMFQRYVLEFIVQLHLAFERSDLFFAGFLVCE